MQHFLIALGLFLAILFFVLFPHKLPPAVTTPQPVWTAAEKDYYRQIFSYTMENIQPGTHYEWASNSGKGVIVPQAVFISKSGATCRKYTETFIVGDQNATESGTSCRRAGDNNGWCRLKEGNALTCAMETVSGAGGLEMGVGRFNSINTNININTDLNMPPGGGNVSGPNVNTNVDVKAPNMPDGKGAADDITGAAGSVAGPATNTGIRWFNALFR